MKKLAEKIKQIAAGKKVEHPNFWMYQ